MTKWICESRDEENRLTGSPVRGLASGNTALHLPRRSPPPSLLAETRPSLAHSYHTVRAHCVRPHRLWRVDDLEQFDDARVVQPVVT